MKGGEAAPWIRQCAKVLQDSVWMGSFLQKGGGMPIRRVYHGPTVAPDVLEAAKMLLTRHGHEHAEVVGSKIPLRRD